MTSPQTPAPSTGEASGKHQGLHQPADDPRVEDALDNIGLDRADPQASGELLEDHLRDRHSKGVRGAYDDSIDRDVAPSADSNAQASPKT